MNSHTHSYMHRIHGVYNYNGALLLLLAIKHTGHQVIVSEGNKVTKTDSQISFLVLNLAITWMTIYTILI